MLRGACFGVDFTLPLPSTDQVSPAFIKVFRTREKAGRPVLVNLGNARIACPHVDPGHCDTLVAGLIKRVLVAVPVPDVKLYEKFLEYVANYLRNYIEPIEARARPTTEEWLARTTYSEKRKEQLRVADISDDEFMQKLIGKDISNKPSRRGFKVKSFIKDEQYQAYKHARWINGREDSYKVKVGPFVKLIEDVIYDHVDPEFGMLVFAKHIPVVERPNAVMRMVVEAAQMYGNDFESFESHFNIMRYCVELMMQCWVAQHVDGFDLFLRAILEGQMVPSECENKLIQWMTEVRRMSGEMSTSVGNGFFNYITMKFIGEESGCKLTVLVEGDDAVIVIRQGDIDHDVVRRLGLKLKLDHQPELNLASFCGQVFDEYDRRVIVDPLKVLGTTQWGPSSLAGASVRTRMRYLRCKALSLAHSNRGCPVVQEYAQLLLRVTRGHDVRAMMKSKHFDAWHRDRFTQITGEVVPVEVSDRSRLVMERVFRVPMTVQVALERMFQQCETLADVDLTCIMHLVPQDWTDYVQKCAHDVNWRPERRGDVPWLEHGGRVVYWNDPDSPDCTKRSIREGEAGENRRWAGRCLSMVGVSIDVARGGIPL